MPNIVHPNGMVEFENLNKHSTHPNPWKPPSMSDQFFHHSSSFYKIFKPKAEETFMKEDPTRNHMKTAPFADRLATWTWRGFIGGVAVSYFDILFVTQSLNMKTNVARAMYLIPPVMCVPMAYVTTREVLEHTMGDKLWTYGVAGIPGGLIWGSFRKSIRSGILAFSLMAAFGSICKMNADTGGFLEGEKIHRTWERNRGLNIWNYRTGTESFDKMDPGPYWKQFVTEDQDPAKHTKV